MIKVKPRGRGVLKLPEEVGEESVPTGGNCLCIFSEGVELLTCVDLVLGIEDLGQLQTFNNDKPTKDSIVYQINIILQNAVHGFLNTGEY